MLFFLLLLFFSADLLAQEENGYDEVPVLFLVPRIGNTEITALIKNEEAWIPLKEVFDYLKIKNTLSANLDSLSGFFIDPKATYLVDKTHDRIKYGEKVFDLSPTDLVQTETGLYLKSAAFLKVFGLDCQFSFRNLSFTLKTNIDLPVLREMQQEQMRKNLSQLKGEKKADTVLKRHFRFLHIGMADWSVTAMQQTNRSNYLRASLTLGATVAGGEARAHLNYYSGQPFEPSKQLYRWRYVNNEFSLVKQVSLGQIISPTVSSIFAPLNGIQITNTPTTYRKSFGSYRYTGTTEPEWMVELYVNNILVDYAKADASGFFAFEIPIVYGSSVIRLKFYGPWGEEHTREGTITIPFNFLPERQLEYTLSAGVVQDESGSRFSRAAFAYGLSKRITFGVGAEYLSSVMQGKPMPFVNASVRLMDGLIVNGEYTRGVRAKATLNYRLPSRWQLDLAYTKFNRMQTAIRYNYLEERKVSLTAPLHWKGFKALSRFTYHQFVLPKLRYSNAEFLLSAVVAGVSTNLRTYARYSGPATPSVYSNLALSFRLPYSIRFSPQAQFQYDQKSFGFLKVEAEKRFSHRGYLTVAYENNRYLHNRSFTVGLRYDLSFARTFFSTSRGNHTNSTTQSASGSLLFDSKAGIVDAGQHARVGRGGFLIVAFLDLNGNGRRDAHEPPVDGLSLRVSGGRVERRSDGRLQVTGLEAYASYLIELDNSSFDNIAWQIKKPTLKAMVEPNRLRLIEVPVAVVGEASGTVYLKTRRQQKGLSRIIVNFFDSSKNLIAHTLTEGDGYFSFLGLAPGRYTAQIDTAQLHILNLTAAPQSLSFHIAGSEEGTLADGFEFILRPVAEKEESADTTENAQAGVERNPKAGEPIKKPAVQDHPAGDSERIQQNASGKKEPAPGDKAPVTTTQKPFRTKASGTNANKLRRATSPRTSPLAQKRPDRVKKQSPRPLKKQSVSKTKQQLRAEQQRLDQKQQQTFRQLRQLLKEQQELIKKQRELIKEIEQLKKQIRKARRSKRR